MHRPLIEEWALPLLFSTVLRLPCGPLLAIALPVYGADPLPVVLDPARIEELALVIETGVLSSFSPHIHLGVRSAGDINGDGYEDIRFGEVMWGENVYLLFGGDSLPSHLELSECPSCGDRVPLSSWIPPDFSGLFPEPAGDPNRDGFDDPLSANAPLPWRNSKTPHDIYVLFGREVFPAVRMIDEDVTLGMALRIAYWDPDIGCSLSGVSAAGDQISFSTTKLYSPYLWWEEE